MQTNQLTEFYRLSEEQKWNLNFILNMIIPVSEDGKLPSAADVNFESYIEKNNISFWISQGLQIIDDEAKDKYGSAFSILSSTEKYSLIESLKRKLFRFFGDVTTQIVCCYYQDDRVLNAIGLEARAPFPIGFFPKDGDFTLLESVYDRGKLYRD